MTVIGLLWKLIKQAIYVGKKKRKENVFSLTV